MRASPEDRVAEDAEEEEDADAAAEHGCTTDGSTGNADATAAVDCCVRLPLAVVVPDARGSGMKEHSTAGKNLGNSRMTMASKSQVPSTLNSNSRKRAFKMLTNNLKMLRP